MMAFGRLASDLRNIEFGAGKSTLCADISKLKSQLYELKINTRLAKLFPRISNIRRLNFVSETALEADLIKAENLWASLEPSLKDHVESKFETYRDAYEGLEREFEFLEKVNYAEEVHLDTLKALKKKVTDCKSEISNLIRGSGLNPVSCLVASIEQRTSVAENTVNLTSMACFKLREYEALVLALKTKNMDKKTEGILTFTNQRFIYESTDNKKAARQLLFERPIDSVAKITKGRVGTFEPEGLLVEFKQPSEPNIKLGTTSQRGYADLAIHFFVLITSGQIDTDLKSGVSLDVRERFKELTTSYAPICGRCKECGVAVSSVIKKFTIDGGVVIGLFDCPECKKPFLEAFSKITSEIVVGVMKDAESTENLSDTEGAKKLVELDRRSDQEFQTNKNAYEKTCELTKEIGEALYRTGGEERMKNVLLMAGSLGCNTRFIEREWNGVGTWQG